MNRAVLALRFVIPKWTFRKALFRILEKLSAVHAKRLTAMLLPAEQSDHGPYRMLFVIQTRTAHYRSGFSNFATTCVAIAM
jgi:hypothetical protein